MAKDRKSRPRGNPDERRRRIAAASLFAAVVIVIVVGGALSTDEPLGESPVPVSESRPPSARVEREPSDPVAPVLESEPAPPVERPTMAAARPGAKTTAPDSLQNRAATDRDRLARSGGNYTVQLMMSCDPDNARRRLDEVDDAARLYVLPFEHNGKACFRLFWGAYRSREGAEKAEDLPAFSKTLDTRVRAIGELT